MSPVVEVLLGDGTVIGDSLVVPKFVPVAECGKLFADVAGVFAAQAAAHERKFRPCVGAVVLRHRPQSEPQVLMGVTASSALRHKLIDQKAKPVPEEKRTGLAHLHTFPKGGVEESDLDSPRPLETTARRELGEEMGIKKRGLLHLAGAVPLVVGIEARAEDKARLFARTGYAFGKAHFYLVFTLGRGGKVRRNPKEMKTAAWVAPAQFEAAISDNRPETASVIRSVYWSALRGFYTNPQVRRSAIA